MPGPRFAIGVAPRGQVDATTAARSPNKRLAGVIIGDGVSALLEITVGDTSSGEGGSGGSGGSGSGGSGSGESGASAQVITRVVQPGDDVDGIKILKINREFDNGRPVTRMYIRENGQDRYIDLRPSPTPPTTGGFGEGSGSSGSSSGSERGAPPGLPFSRGGRGGSGGSSGSSAGSGFGRGFSGQ